MSSRNAKYQQHKAVNYGQSSNSAQRPVQPVPKEPQNPQMSLKTAITLLSLRVGKVESMLHQQSLLENMTGETGESGSTNNAVIQTLMQRLQKLEQNSSVPLPPSNTKELDSIKLNIKNILIANNSFKTTLSKIIKTNKEDNTKYEVLNEKVEEMVQTISALQSSMLANFNCEDNIDELEIDEGEEKVEEIDTIQIVEDVEEVEQVIEEESTINNTDIESKPDEDKTTKQDTEDYFIEE